MSSSLPFHTFAIDPAIQTRAKKHFLQQAERNIFRLLNENRLDAVVAVAIVKRAARNEMLDPG